MRRFNLSVKTLGFLFVVFFLFAAPLQAATLTWTDTADNEDGFIVESGSGTAWKEIGRTVANTTSFTDPSGQLGQCYRVVAFNALGGSSPSNIACLPVPPPPPPAPPFVSLTLTGNPALEDWTVEAKTNVAGDIRIEFEVNSKVFRVESSAPYALFPQTGDVLSKSKLGPGVYTIIARVYEQTGTVALATSPMLTVTEGTTPQAPTTLIVVE